MIYIYQLIIAIVVCYIVDVSGFTQSWRNLLKRKLQIKELRPLPPFDCGECMVWWTTLLFPIFIGQFSIWTLLASAILSLLSVTIDAFLLFIREILLKFFDIITPR